MEMEMEVEVVVVVHATVAFAADFDGGGRGVASNGVSECVRTRAFVGSGGRATRLINQ